MAEGYVKYETGTTSRNCFGLNLDWKIIYIYVYIYIERERESRTTLQEKWNNKSRIYIKKKRIYKFKKRKGRETYIAFLLRITIVWGFPGSISDKESAKAGDVRDAGSIPGWGISPGGRHANPLQYSCLENPMDRGIWWATVHRVANSPT